MPVALRYRRVSNRRSCPSSGSGQASIPQHERIKRGPNRPLYSVQVYLRIENKGVGWAKPRLCRYKLRVPSISSEVLIKMSEDPASGTVSYAGQYRVSNQRLYLEYYSYDPETHTLILYKDGFTLDETPYYYIGEQCG